MMKVILTYIIAITLILVGLATTGELRYFPIDKTGVKGISEFEHEWYSKALKRMDEPSFLITKATPSQLFRFTLLPTWGNPISVRLSIKDGVGVVEGKRLDGQGGYDPGKLVEKTSVILKKTEMDQFLSLYAKMKFFGLNTADDVRGLDGSQWIFEATNNGTYHVVVRWTPTEYDPEKRQTVSFVNVCNWLYRKAGFKNSATNKGHTLIRK